MNLESKWKEAEKNLKEFNKKMELIRKYPIKPPITVNNYTPYAVQDSIEYSQSSFWK